MYNEQMYELGNHKSSIRSIFEYGQKRIKEVGEENVFDFSIGNPSLPAPKFVADAIVDLITKEDPRLVHSYTTAQGKKEVRDALAKDLNHRFKLNIDGDNLFLTSGAMAGISIAFKSLYNAGDNFITFAPYFPEYKTFVESMGGELFVVPAKKDDFQMDLDMLEDMINEKTTAIIINSPNNPSGAVYKEESLKKLAKILDKKTREFGRRIYIISDEPYRDIIYTGEYPFVTKYYKDTLVCYSYSKSYSLAGERIGYILVNPEMDDYEKVLKSVMGSARVLTHVNASSLFQLVIGRCAGKSIDMTPYKENGEIFYKGLVAAGFTCLEPQGAFYLFPKALEEDDRAFCKKAMEYDLLLVPGSDFGCEGYFRASYCVKRETIEKSIPIFKKLAKYYGK